MEIGLEAGMPTYAGGLGVLAGDTVRAAAGLRVPMAVVTLFHRKRVFSTAPRSRRRPRGTGRVEAGKLPCRVAGARDGRDRIATR
jgi:hypothetical protein